MIFTANSIVTPEEEDDDDDDDDNDFFLCAKFDGQSNIDSYIDFKRTLTQETQASISSLTVKQAKSIGKYRSRKSPHK